MTVPISVSVRPSTLRLGEWSITEAVSAKAVHDRLGPPTRIVDPCPPPPVGHRNNMMHVYDDYGFYFNEHHYTRRMQGVVLVLCPEEQQHGFSPEKAFDGTIDLEDATIHSETTEADLRRLNRIREWCGTWDTTCGSLSVFITMRGHKLPSGKRSRSRRIVDVSIGWPHDPWKVPDALGSSTT